MLEEVKKLLIIQDRDQTIAKLEKELARLPGEEVQARERLAGDEAAVEDLRNRIRENALATKNLEIDVETRRNTINKLKLQQYETKKNEEFRAINHEIDRYGGEVEKLEDDELELMEAAEVLKSQLAEARTRMTETAKLVDDELAQIATRRGHAEQNLAGLKEECSQLAAGIEEATLDRYRRIFSKKKDAAVAPLQNGICGGCHMKVTNATLSNVKNEKEIAFCEQCGRILYQGD